MHLQLQTELTLQGNPRYRQFAVSDQSVSYIWYDKVFFGLGFGDRQGIFKGRNLSEHKYLCCDILPEITQQTILYNPRSQYILVSTLYHLRILVAYCTVYFVCLLYI